MSSIHSIEICKNVKKIIYGNFKIEFKFQLFSYHPFKIKTFPNDSGKINNSMRSIPIFSIHFKRIFIPTGHERSIRYQFIHKHWRFTTDSSRSRREKNIKYQKNHLENHKFEVNCASICFSRVKHAWKKIFSKCLWRFPF